MDLSPLLSVVRQFRMVSPDRQSRSGEIDSLTVPFQARLLVTRSGKHILLVSLTRSSNLTLIQFGRLSELTPRSQRWIKEKMKNISSPSHKTY